MGNHGNINPLTSSPGCRHDFLQGHPRGNKGGPSGLTHRSTMWGHPVMERWFINPMNTIVIGTINHSEIGVINQLTIVIGTINHGYILELCAPTERYM